MLMTKVIKTCVVLFIAHLDVNIKQSSPIWSLMHVVVHVLLMEGSSRATSNVELF